MPNTTAVLHRWEGIAPEQLNPLASRQYLYGDQAMLCRFDLRQNAVVPRHSHPNEQISHVVSGCLRFLLGEELEVEHIVRAGEILVIPANLPHRVETLEDTIAFDIFAPPRQDWITGQDAYLR
ncbi:MAG: cupin domain-containing protein [Acidobacteriota bacterium]|nr:cupin domain-containing protein [Acidobacteriota bacterium]